MQNSDEGEGALNRHERRECKRRKERWGTVMTAAQPTNTNDPSNQPTPAEAGRQ